MNETLLGKFLVRKVMTSHDGVPIVILCGVFYSTEPLDNIDDRDELWVAELQVAQVKKYVNKDNLQFSPEDFLENLGDIQLASKWEIKNE